MFFTNQEKIFSLRKTVAALPRHDLTKLWEEFYCYLLVSGIFSEASVQDGLYQDMVPISDKEFYLESKSYHNGIGSQLSKGLQDRYYAILKHEDTNERDRFFLKKIDYIFTKEKGYYSDLTGKDLYATALVKNFSEDMLTVAHYVAVSFGQKSYPESSLLNKLYFSVFGNIHLSKNIKHLVNQPELVYASNTKSGDRVTPLFALASSQLNHFVNETNFSGDALCDYLSGFNFISDPYYKRQVTTIPAQASINTMSNVIGVNEFIPIELSRNFYRNFFYGSLNEIKILRIGVLIDILNIMMKKMGETQLRHLFNVDSSQALLTNRTKFNSRISKSPSLFTFALEALEAQENQEEAVSPSDKTLEEKSSEETDLNIDQELEDDVDEDNPDIVEDPQTSPGGYDPTNVPSNDPVGKTTDNDSIGLISLDKSGEGVDDDLYRSAVVSLNDRLKQDENLAIEQDIKDALDYWVNGFLYKASIQATKDYIASLKLAQYLKVFN